MPTTYRIPTEQEIGEALRYVECEFVLKIDADGRAMMDDVHWTEALAFGPGRVGFPALPLHVEQARYVLPQLTEFQWLDLAARAESYRLDQHMPRLYGTYTVTGR